MSNDTEDQLDLLTTMLEGIMQTQEFIVMSLLRDGALDKAGLKARLEHAAKKPDLRLGTHFPLSRMLDVLKGAEPPPPPWSPTLIRGGKPD